MAKGQQPANATAAVDGDAYEWNRTLFAGILLLLVFHAYTVGYLVRDLSGPNPVALGQRNLLSGVAKIGGAVFSIWLATYVRPWSARLGFLSSAGVSLLFAYMALAGELPGGSVAIIVLSTAALVALGLAAVRGSDASWATRRGRPRPAL